MYPNALHAALIRGNGLFVPNEGAAPEPPVQFRVNVQYLVGTIDITTGKETGGTVNINAQIAKEPAPGNFDPVLDRLFGNTPGGIDADPAGKRFLLVSRGGNYVIEATLDSQGKLDIRAPDNVVRYQTGNIPTGVVMSSDEKRAYTNDEVSTSVTSIDLVNQQVLQQDINSSDPPDPGTQAHRNVVGKLVFFTALGTPDQGCSRHRFGTLFLYSSGVKPLTTPGVRVPHAVTTAGRTMWPGPSRRDPARARTCQGLLITRLTTPRVIRAL